MHSDGVQNDLQLQRKNENNISEACIIPTVFETTWNCREKMKTMSLKHAFWRYF